MTAKTARKKRFSRANARTVFYVYIANGRLWFRLMTYMLLIVLSFVFIYPFIYMLVTSVMSSRDLLDISVEWIPRQPTFSHYTVAWKLVQYPRHLLISVVYVLSATVIHVVMNSYIAYGLARYRFPGRNLLLVIMVLSILIPSQVLILPTYLEFATLKWVGNYLPLIVPLVFGFGLKSGLFIFLFRQFFISLPKQLEEAARIDGCGFFGTFWRIVFPTARTSTIVCVVLSLVWHWNEYYDPIIYLSDIKLWPLTSMLPMLNEAYLKTLRGEPALINGSNTSVDVALVMAATVLVILPVLIAYAFLQRQFMQGIERTGIVE